MQLLQWLHNQHKKNQNATTINMLASSLEVPVAFITVNKNEVYLTCLRIQICKPLWGCDLCHIGASKRQACVDLIRDTRAICLYTIMEYVFKISCRLHFWDTPRIIRRNSGSCINAVRSAPHSHHVVLFEWPTQLLLSV